MNLKLDSSIPQWIRILLSTFVRISAWANLWKQDEDFYNLIFSPDNVNIDLYLKKNREFREV